MLIANAYDDIRGFNAELAGFYFPNLETGISLPPVEASVKMDEYEWTGGWRAQDTPEQDIWFGGCPDCLFQDIGLYFILETSSMRVTKITRLGIEDILKEIERIDIENP